MFLDTHITNFCNLDCRHCYLEDKNTMHMDLGVLKDLAKQYSELNGNSIVISGGEPSLHPNIKEIIEYIHELGLKISFISNGNNYKNIVSYLDNDDTYQISIDGNEFMHDWLRGMGSFETATSALEEADKQGINKGFMFTVHEGNKFYVKHVIKKVFYKYNCDNMSLTNYIDHEHKFSVLKETNAKEFFNLLSYAYRLSNQSYRKKCYEKLDGCVAGVKGCSILPDGTYWDCSRNQKIIGKYPDKLEEVLTLGENIDPANTCAEGE